MRIQVFYYRIPYSNEKYHKNLLVLARKTVLFYFSGILVVISMPNPEEVCMKPSEKNYAMLWEHSSHAPEQ